ncbi:hypothetical protein HDF16_006301 [Granulicella aggregans]|uniref:Caspase family p20 domain-containing protein n=1 Tax=Granulicella aggregans TaxID=474949 RepID=A0A7W8E8R4_9BACT|nr:caspase family protein [Granulicella aggregans]MBB5061565.1 hypothetical protein [Granulicella aggregans]
MSLREKALALPRTAAPEVKKKDSWDKAGVLASILSSVVIASLTLVLNHTIQQTQVDMQAQQLKASQETARREERNQNAKATTDLIQYLLSGEPAKQRIALIALRRAVQDDDDLVVNIVSVVASTSKDQSVYSTATDTLQASHDPRVSRILADMSVAQSKEDPKRSVVAYQAAQRVGVQAAVGSGTTIVYATPAGGYTFESAAAGAGVFTHALIDTLQSNIGPVKQGVLDLSKLASYLNPRIALSTPSQPMPFVVNDGSTSIPLWAPAKTQVLAIGIAKYTSPAIPSLLYSARDAQAFTALMKSHGAEVSTMIDVTQNQILKKIDEYASNGDDSGTFVLYFAGHGWNSKGVQRLAAADSFPPSSLRAELTQPQTRGIILPQDNGMPLSDIMQHIERLPFRHKLVFIDACANEVETGNR